MLKTAIITAATALAISAGAFGVTSASADSYHGPARVEHRAERWHGERHWRGPARVCKPILRSVKVRGHHGWHFKRVVVGERCHFVRRGW